MFSKEILEWLQTTGYIFSALISILPKLCWDLSGIESRTAGRKSGPVTSPENLPASTFQHPPDFNIRPDLQDHIQLAVSGRDSAKTKEFESINAKLLCNSPVESIFFKYWFLLKPLSHFSEKCCWT